MMTESIHRLRCPSCGTAHPLPEVFEHCLSSLPEHYLLNFSCPSCRSRRQVRVRDDGAAVGYLDSAPGPRFVTQDEISQPGLCVISTDDGIELSLDEHCWFIGVGD